MCKGSISTSKGQHDLSLIIGKNDVVSSSGSKICKDMDYNVMLTSTPPLSSLNWSENENGGVCSTSVLDNKETFVDFRNINSEDRSNQKNSFTTAYYRHRNLKLADKLEDHTRGFEIEINKVIRSLRFCSSLSIVHQDSDGSGSIDSSSKSCKSPHCGICARNRATKLSNRLIRAVADPKNKLLFKGKNFYFLTLTVRHGNGVREGVYIDEFNSYVKKLRNSKIWKKYFPYSKENPLSGAIRGTESVIGVHGYHIHAHLLLCCPPFKEKIKKIESALRAKWLKLTGDSDVIRLDTIKMNRNEVLVKKSDIISSNQYGAVKEVFKYAVKVGSMNNLVDDRLDMYVNWIVETKGKNFVNASGLFRGLELTGCRSRYDIKGSEETVARVGRFYIGKTANIRFSKSPKFEYSTKSRQRIMKSVFMRRLGSSFQDISDIHEEMRNYLAFVCTESRIDEHMSDWIQFERSAKEEKAFYLRQIDDEDFGESSQVEAMVRQFELFDQVHLSIKEFFDSSKY